MKFFSEAPPGYFSKPSTNPLGGRTLPGANACAWADLAQYHDAGVGKLPAQNPQAGQRRHRVADLSDAEY